VKKLRTILKSIAILIISTFILEGFACTSRDMMTAKNKQKRGEFAEAAKYLEKELVKNPNNEEAILMLAEIRLEQKLLQETAHILRDAEEKNKIKTKKYAEKLPILKNRLWIDCYNMGTKFHNDYLSSNDASNLDSSIYYNEVGRILRPHILEWYSRISQAYMLKGDTVKGNQFLDEFTQILHNEIEFGFDNGIYMTQDVEEALTKIGASSKAKFDTTEREDILRSDVFSLDSNNFWFYSYKKAGDKNFVIKGWRMNLPDDLTPQESGTWWETNLYPFNELSAYYYDRKEYDNSLKYLKMLQKLNPTDQKVNTSIVQVYTNQNKEQEAIDYLVALTNKDPNNKVYYQLHADFLFNFNKYDEAIEIYQKALDIDDNYGLALRNMASAYKNKASLIQSKEKEKLDKDPKYVVNNDEFFPLLEKAASYFERASVQQSFRLDVDLFRELSNIYLVMDKKAELDKSIKRIEAMKYKVAPERREDILFVLLKIYSDLKNDAKAKEIQNEIEKFNK